MLRPALLYITLLYILFCLYFFLFIFKSCNLGKKIKNYCKSGLTEKFFFVTIFDSKNWEKTASFDTTSFLRFSKNLDDITIKRILAVVHNMLYLEPVIIKSEAIRVRRAGLEFWSGNIGVMQFGTKIPESIHKLNKLSR